MSNPIQSRNENTGQRGASGDECLHCPECGYDLRGQTVQRCPECGFHYDRPGIAFVNEKKVAACLSPMLDAITALAVALSLLSLIVPVLLLLAAMMVAVMLLLTRGTEKHRAPRLREDVEALRERVLPVLLRAWLPWPVVSWLRLLFVAIFCFIAATGSRHAYPAVAGGATFLGFGWLFLGLLRMKDIPASDGNLALPMRLSRTLVQAERLAIALLVADLLGLLMLSCWHP